MTDPTVLQRQVARERAAREAAERLLEEKSRQLSQAVTTLQDAKVLLEKEVEERRQAEEVLRQNDQRLRSSQQRLNAIMNSVVDAVITIDSDGKVHSFNRGAERIFGFSMTEVLGQNVSLLMPEPHRSQHGFHIARYLTSGQSGSIGVTREVTAARKDGGEFPLELAVNELDLEGERLFVGVCRDITRRKQRESERLALERELSQSQKMESLGTLSGGIAHELNTPIQYVGDNVRFLEGAFEDLAKVLQAYAPLAQAAEQAGDPGGLANAVAAVVEEADLEYLAEEVPVSIKQTLEGVERVSKIVQAIKEFAHPDGGAKAPIDVNRAIETTATVTRNQWKYVAELKFDFDPDLPQVPCLAGEFNQVILNLIVNAADAVEDKGGEDTGVITVSTRSDGDWAEIRVSDTGTGIPADLRERIFDPFFTTKEPGRGSGQGLSICHTIIHKKHEGELNVESVDGEGTTFIIRLPLGRTDRGKEAA